MVLKSQTTVGIYKVPGKHFRESRMDLTEKLRHGEKIDSGEQKRSEICADVSAGVRGVWE